MKSVMVHQFSNVPGPSIQRSSFDRSHGRKTTFQPQVLVPIYVDEMLPGDTFNMNCSAFIRMASQIVPPMDNLRFDVHFFFVPYRLVWDNFKKFMGEQVDPGDSTDYLIPTTSATGTALVNTIWDYMGLPVGSDYGGWTVSALPFRSYNLVWNEWYRDENLQDSVTVARTDGPDLPTLYAILPRNKQHDYFTSALPWPQKNNTGTSVDFLAGAPVVGDGGNINVLQGATPYALYANTGQPNVQNNIGNFGATDYLKADPTGVVPSGYEIGPSTVGTINALRQAFQIQKLYERDARGGSRYTEIIRAHFGVISPDARLQRPEYLGGGSVSLNSHPVAQTQATGASGTTTPQGNLASFGTAGGSGIGFVYSATEHGTVLGLVSTRVDLTYQNGIDRMWLRRTRLDFYWPALSHIGEQAITLQELQWYAPGGTPDAYNDDVFGYQERYAEYRYKQSRVTGYYRSNVSGTLDVWHFSQDYSVATAGRISLNDTFIRQPYLPVLRNTAVPSQPVFLADFYFKLRCARPMPVYSVPGLIDHF